MTKFKPAPEAPDTIAQRAAELDAIRKEIAAVEAALPALAQSDDDAAFESASLNIERLRRAELRAVKRLEGAREAVVAAKTHKEQERRRSLFEAGLVARAEAERLASSYGEHAAAIADILRNIDKLRGPVEAANAYLPEGERTIDAHALEIHSRVELPATTKDGPKFWWRPDYYGFDPLNPPPAPKFVPQVRADLMASPPATPGVQRQVETGPRRFTMPACERPGATR